MTTQTAIGRSTDRIERILNAIEHIWKLYPSLTFGQVVAKATEGEELSLVSDEEVEANLRTFLRNAFANARDKT